MVTENYQIDRRVKNNMSENNVERDIGKLIASVNSLITSKVEERQRMEKGFSDLYQEIEKLSKQFTEYKLVHDEQSKVDYGYMDGKVVLLDKRVTKIEEQNELRNVSRWSKFSASALDAIAKLSVGGIALLAMYVVINYLKDK